MDDLRRREYELDTFQPNGLNERDVALFLTFFLTLPFSIVLISSGLIHYIYCSTLNFNHNSASPHYFAIYPYCCHYCYYYCYYYYCCCYYYYHYYYYLYYLIFIIIIFVINNVLITLFTYFI